MAHEDVESGRCRSCGEALPTRRPSVHACDWWSWLDHQVELRRDDLDRFEREFATYLRTPRGRFDVWEAERLRPLD